MKSQTTFKFLWCLFFLSLSNTTIQAQQPTDCINAVTVCGNSEINLDVNGIGIQELNGLNNCQSNENNSIWLKVTLVTDGTLGFILTPQSTNIIEDYDFFVFGPNADCGNLNTAIRCSTTNPQAANQGNNLTGMNDTPSNETSEGPGQFGDSFVEWLTVSAGDSYYIVIDRPIGNSPFNLEWIGTAEFASPPDDASSTNGTSDALNIENCDTVAPFNDASTTFDLTENTASIIGSQTNVSVSYFESESDANIDINAINGPFTNTPNPQEVYAKITDDITGCFKIIPFELTVSDGPDFTAPSDYNLCDNTDDGDAMNGRVVFNLETRNTEILNGQNATEFNISYHENLLDAQNNNNPVPNLYYNNSPFQETLVVRIENAMGTNCFSTTEMTLNVFALPEALNDSQTQCSNDSFSVFNLENSTAMLTGNSPDRTVTFYRNLIDAEANQNEITNRTNFENTTNPQTLFAQVTNTETACFNISELTLNVSNTIVTNSEIQTCDDDGNEDGFHEFDLSDVETEILNGLPNTVTITYYEFAEDAYIQENPINTIFTNTIVSEQTVYARVNNADDCFGIAEINLIVNPLPPILTEDFVYYCLNTYPETITISAGITNNNYNYNWDSGQTTPNIEVNEIGTYTVTVTESGTNCSKEKIITVQPSNVATFESIDIIDASDTNTVTVIVSGEGSYEFALYNENGMFTPFQPSNSFTNIPSGFYTVHVRDIKNNCGIIQEDIAVIGFPKVFTPNGDGTNDTWNIKGASTMVKNNTKILIFDRYGKLVKQLNPLSNGWDGTLNGAYLPVSDYWFAITLNDGRVIKDHFTLKR